jgi:hypothetical protein
MPGPTPRIERRFVSVRCLARRAPVFFRAAQRAPWSRGGTIQPFIVAPRTRNPSVRLAAGLLVAFGGLGLGNVGCLNPRPDVQPSVDSAPPNPNGLAPGDSLNPNDPNESGSDGDRLDDGMSNEDPARDPDGPTGLGNDGTPPIEGESPPPDAGSDAGADAGR